MGTDMDWAWLRRNLPPGVEPGFDGQVTTRTSPDIACATPWGSASAWWCAAAASAATSWPACARIVGGEITEYTEMLEEARRHAVDRLVRERDAMGANAIIMMRFDSSEIGQTMSEIVAYGTAVVLEPARGPARNGPRFRRRADDRRDHCRACRRGPAGVRGDRRGAADRARHSIRGALPAPTPSAPGPGWERTGERFREPGGEGTVEVWYHERTGRRRYVRGRAVE